MFVKEGHQFLPPFKNVSRQVLLFQKDSVFKTEHTISIQRNEMYAKEDNQLLSPSKKCIPT